MSRRRRLPARTPARCPTCGGPLALVGSRESSGLRVVCIATNLPSRGAVVPRSGAMVGVIGHATTSERPAHL